MKIYFECIMLFYVRCMIDIKSYRVGSVDHSQVSKIHTIERHCIVDTCRRVVGRSLSSRDPLYLSHFPDASLYPPLQRIWKGGILVSPCPSVRLSVCPSVDRIVSALYLQQYSSDPFHFCTSYQATSEGVSHVMPVSKFKNLKVWRIF